MFFCEVGSGRRDKDRPGQIERALEPAVDVFFWRLRVDELKIQFT